MTDPFLEELSRPRPDPGGGAAAAYGASVALALLEKVARIELHRPQPYSGPSALWESLLRRVSTLASDALRLREDDMQAYRKLSEARSLGRGSPELPAAVEEAVQCPLRITNTAELGLGALAEAGRNCRKLLVSDLQVACEILKASGEGACHIAAANLPLLGNDSSRDVLIGQIERARNTLRREFESTCTVLLSRSLAGGETPSG